MVGSLKIRSKLTIQREVKVVVSRLISIFPPCPRSNLPQYVFAVISTKFIVHAFVNWILGERSFTSKQVKGWCRLRIFSIVYSSQVVKRIMSFVN